MRREPGRIVYSPTGVAVSEALSVLPFLDTHPQLVGLWATFANGILGITGPLGVTASSLDEYVQDAVSDAEQALGEALRGVGEYFYEVIAHLAKRDHLIHDISADPDGLIVRHHRRPRANDLLPPFLPGTHEVSPTNADGAVARVSVGVSRGIGEPTGSTESEAPGRPAPAPASGPGAGPDLDAPGRPAAHRSRRRPRRGLREGEIDHIVVLVLENRSFDHMLGYRGLATTNVNGLTGAEPNLLDQGIAPYEVFHLTKTYGIRSPDHGFEATLEQIDGGRMDGFVRNYAAARCGGPQPGDELLHGRRTAHVRVSRQQLRDLRQLAQLTSGETQCNRFCAITGQTPELDNLDVTDGRLAYYDGHTIFDSLTDLDVDWVYAEGNIGFLRMFDRYRIDIEHVIPFRDDFNQGIADTFEQRVLDGRLPSVSFVDPRYIDVPPQWDANDDLPPADVCRGQELVRHLYRLLSEAEGTWKRTLLVITYDEHGGFYDHSPPIGTPLSADPTPVPRVHPDGAEHLGVRVPTFVVTP
jgi:phospholipase C